MAHISLSAQLFAASMYLYTSRAGNSVDPNQLASEKPADLDLYCNQKQNILQSSIEKDN